MDWIKKNYDQGLLALLAFALIGISALLFLNANNFKEKFADAAAVPTLNRKLPELDTAAIEAAKQKLDAPKLWSSGNHQNLLFTSEPYIVENGQLKPIRGGAFLHHTETGEEIPNEWWKQYGISVTGESILTEDPDGDGFVNQDEWKYNTDPTKKESFPPYITRLFLSRWIKVPFRFKFLAANGDPKKPETMEFQVNPLDAGAATQFLKLDQPIEGTKYKVSKFEFKEKLNESTQEKEDVSELTVVNTETNESVVLALDKVVDSPNQFAEFDYRWNTPPGQKGQIFAVNRLKEFVLKPEIDQKYKLLDVNATEAVVETPKGEKVTIKLAPAAKAAAPQTPAAPAEAAPAPAPGTVPAPAPAPRPRPPAAPKRK